MSITEYYNWTAAVCLFNIGQGLRSDRQTTFSGGIFDGIKNPSSIHTHTHTHTCIHIAHTHFKHFDSDND